MDGSIATGPLPPDRPDPAGDPSGSAVPTPPPVMPPAWAYAPAPPVASGGSPAVPGAPDDPAGPVAPSPLPAAPPPFAPAAASGLPAAPVPAAPPRARGAGRGGRRRARDTRTLLGRLLDRIDPRLIGLLLFALALFVYLASNPRRIDFYDHFTWQAAAWLEGSVAIRWPVSEGIDTNDYFQDILPLEDQPGRALIPFPPMPALLLVPFVAIWGLATSAAVVAAVLGALNVALCWRMLLRVTERRDAAFLGAIFYGFGTVAWYAAMLGNTWFYAHVVASTFLFLSITAALDGERRERIAGAARRIGGILVPRAMWAGFLQGLGMLARLTSGFGAIFLVFVGPGGGWFRRGLSAAIGAVIPVALLIAYNLTATGHVFHPAYEYLYKREYRPVAAFWNDTWAIEDPRYIPQNAVIMLLWPPERPIEEDPECAGQPNLQGADILFHPQCPLLRPSPIGMSILLTSPAYLLALGVILRGRRDPIVVGATLAILLVAVVNLMHFSQGWVQFGYRFSNDFAPYATILVTLGIARALRNRSGTALAVVLVGASVLVNAWGVWWGVQRGW